VFVGRGLAVIQFRGKSLLEALLALPLVLPPTVLGFYLLTAFGGGSWIDGVWQRLFDRTLVFSFEGLVLASAIVNIPLAIQPAQRAFDSIPDELREAAASCGMSWWTSLWRIELPLAWPGIVTGMVFTFAHTLGEFGVVLMIGGSIPGETRTVAIAIYDRVQAFDFTSAAEMAVVLSLISVVAIAASFVLSRRANQPGG
jgi:molybdate transport system permease protein